MQLTHETREILNKYKAIINENRREAGLTALSDPRLVEEICVYMTYQNAVYIGGVFITQSTYKKHSG